MKVKPTFDEYIGDCEDFAKPIMNYLRELVHRTCPAIEEKIKWNFPCFVYKGSSLAYMAAFKNHATFEFGLHSKMTDSHKVFVHGENTGMGNLGKITSIDELPKEEILIEYLHEAMILHDQGFKQTLGKRKPISKSPIHPHFEAELTKENIHSQFETFSTSQQNDYADWISDAKAEATREKRINQAIEWISEGKPRNWKYMKNWKGKTE